MGKWYDRVIERIKHLAEVNELKPETVDLAINFF